MNANPTAIRIGNDRKTPFILIKGTTPIIGKF
jgi:hypothetical protein